MAQRVPHRRERYGGMRTSAIAALLLASALAASLIPARRAATVDAIRALRSE
jgi:ABC-type lipoprotein release transport system permease subunit